MINSDKKTQKIIKKLSSIFCFILFDFFSGVKKINQKLIIYIFRLIRKIKVVFSSNNLKKMEQKQNFYQLSDNLNLMIFSYLEAKDYIKLASVNSFFHRFITRNPCVFTREALFFYFSESIDFYWYEKKLSNSKYFFSQRVHRLCRIFDKLQIQVGTNHEDPYKVLEKQAKIEQRFEEILDSIDKSVTKQSQGIDERTSRRQVYRRKPVGNNKK